MVSQASHPSHFAALTSVMSSPPDFGFRHDFPHESGSDASVVIVAEGNHAAPPPVTPEQIFASSADPVLGEYILIVS